MLSSLREAVSRADERYVRWFNGDQKPAEVRGQASDWGSWPGEMPVSVTPDGALKLLAVSGSVQLLADSIATLPVDVFRKRSSGRENVMTPMWLREPVVGLTFVDWCTQVLTSLLLHGNAYLIVTRDAGGRIVELVPVDALDVSPTRNGTLGGALRYLVRGVPFTGELVHIRGMMLAGSDVGLSPLEFARVSIEGGLSAQQYGVDNFNSGLKMPGVIEFPGAVDPAKMGETARLWQRSRRKGGHGLPGVLEGGGTFKPIGISNEAAQFLQTRQWTAAEICAQVYLIDPRELGIPLTGSTLEYVNSESRMANLVRKGMLRWIVRLELALSSLLPSPQYVKFNVNGFMRGDSTERWDTYLKAAQINEAAARVGQGPVLLTDEMRAWEELDPLPDMPAVDPEPTNDLQDGDVNEENQP
jgi:HK97 family phage portal protein